MRVGVATDAVTAKRCRSQASAQRIAGLAVAGLGLTTALLLASASPSAARGLPLPLGIGQLLLELHLLSVSLGCFKVCAQRKP